MRAIVVTLSITLLVSAILLARPRSAPAHCDGMDGPVVRAAREALESGDVAPILIWVQQKDESEVREAFRQTLAVRILGGPAKELADQYLFETVVRIHRTGEGASYTGLKPAGRDLGPAIPAADRAVRDRSSEPLVKLLTAAVQRGVGERFAAVKAKQAFAPGNVAAGRAYVQAYVRFVHYVERLYEAAVMPAEGHFPEMRPAEVGEHAATKEAPSP